jgi:hypothetical protein
VSSGFIHGIAMNNGHLFIAREGMSKDKKVLQT